MTTSDTDSVSVAETHPDQTARKPSTASRQDASAQKKTDSEVLECILETLLVLDDDHPARKSIQEIKISNINDITSLTAEDIRSIQCLGDNGYQPIPPHAIGILNTLRCLTHFYFDNDEELDWMSLTREDFASTKSVL